MKNLEIGGIYKHFKGAKVQVICEALHSETEEPFVVYIHLENNVSWVRPKEMFLENVDRDGYKGPRFKYIGE